MNKIKLEIANREKLREWAEWITNSHNNNEPPFNAEIAGEIVLELLQENEALEARLGPAGAKMLHDLKEERDRYREEAAAFRECLKEIVQRGYTGAKYIARECLGRFPEKKEV